MKQIDVKRVLATLAIVTATNHDGFTYNIQDDKMQSNGFAVALAATQDSFGVDGLLKVVDYAIENNIQCVGGWLDNETGKFYFDATMIVDDLDTAIALGKQNGQLAIFNIDTLEEIRL